MIFLILFFLCFEHSVVNAERITTCYCRECRMHHNMLLSKLTQHKRAAFSRERLQYKSYTRTRRTTATRNDNDKRKKMGRRVEKSFESGDKFFFRFFLFISSQFSQKSKYNCPKFATPIFHFLPHKDEDEADKHRTNQFTMLLLHGFKVCWILEMAIRIRNSFFNSILMS